MAYEVTFFGNQKELVVTPHDEHMLFTISQDRDFGASVQLDNEAIEQLIKFLTFHLETNG